MRILTYNFMRDNYAVWPLSDTIFHVVGKGGIIPAFHIDFKGKWIALQDYKSALTNKDVWGGSLNKYARWIKDFVLMEDGCFFGFKYDKDYFVKWQDGKVFLYSSLLEGLPEMREAAVCSTEDSLIYVYAPDDIKEYAKTYPVSDNSELERLYKLAEDENVNPVLLFVPVNQN
ncbi:MAG: hypothetical protein LUE99_17050 [Bacteroides sp.]|nr:hypothetical protein [Bacteroides sp.]